MDISDENTFETSPSPIDVQMNMCIKYCSFVLLLLFKMIEHLEILDKSQNCQGMQHNKQASLYYVPKVWMDFLLVKSRNNSAKIIL